MKTNTKTNKIKAPIFTEQGGLAFHINDEQALERSVMASLLFENNFYEDGVSISERIASLVPKVAPKKVEAMAIRARNEQKLRHIPLFLAKEMLKYKKHKGLVSNILETVIQRPDELTEFLALYWKEGKTPIANQAKKGLAKAFTKFNEYSLAKYNQKNDIKLKDILFLTHAKPIDKAQDKLWKKLIDNKLETPDTWEVELSQSTDKKESWTRLLKEEKLGGLAFLRNLRNMIDANVNEKLIKESFKTVNFDKVLPFRFIAAAKYARKFEPELEVAMIKAVDSLEKIKGKTVLLIDVSGSMDAKLSDKSENSRLETACALAILAREICETVEVYTFSFGLIEVAPRHGFALRDAIFNSQAHGGTNLRHSLNQLHSKTKYDRLIVFTDEQSSDKPSAPNGKGYVINVANNQNGVGYGKWLHIDGFSEAVITYIQQYELMESLAKTFNR